MKNKIMTIILTLISMVLIAGIVILGIAMYKDVTGDTREDITYKIGNIWTEEPSEKQNKSVETSTLNISESIENTNEVENKVIDNDDEIGKFFYKQLSKNQEIIYDKLLESKDYLKQGNYKIEFGNEFYDTLSQENGDKQLWQDYQTAIEAFLHDNVDLFYLDVNKMYINIETITKLLRKSYNVYISAKEGETYFADGFTSTEQIDRAIGQIEETKNNIIRNLSGNDYKKIMTIHDYIIDNVEYDSTYEALGTYSLYGAFIGKTCVCEGYAKSLKYLANSINIECEIMQGTATNSTGKTESHAWNCIKLDGNWYLMDPTWDDPIIVGNGYKVNVFKYKYFLKGSQNFEKDHVLSYQFSDGGKKFKYPTISERDYE